MADVTNEASYSSADEDIATISDNGVITAVAAGETEITVSYENETATVSVTVEEPEPEVQIINANPDNVTLEEGDTQELEVEANYR
ncbi:Ig-like domain-containing protein [Oceanobacillus oncorhynchi]|uniref:Ig-like domain-containing protein n=1 Tax=Oceanobacillus oncorhynchi TaxID=545501 RepID=UPI0018688773|nr:Ig-like domain-containing protein [Oceanobacillus oncorhynchi]